MGFQSAVKRRYRKTFGHRSPYKRTFGSRTPRQAMNVTFKQYDKAIKEIKEIKERLNVEKKYKDADVSTDSVGQVNHNGDGYVVYDVTPSITQGIDGDERVGNSLKMTGLTFPIQLSQQVSCFGARKVRVSLLRVTSADNGVTGTEAVEDFWDTNPLTGVRDINAPRAYRNSKTDGIKCLRTARVHVPAPVTDAATAGTVDNTETNSKTFRVSVKLQDIFRYNASSDTAPDGLRYYLVFQCDTGNKSASNSGLDVPVTTNSSGLVLDRAPRS